jgi:hypothetical protein
VLAFVVFIPGRYFGSSNPAYRKKHTRQSKSHCTPRDKLTIDNNLHAESLGCAPTPNQYFALVESSLISFHMGPSPSIDGLGIGSYVPRTSRGLLFRAVLVSVISNWIYING